MALLKSSRKLKSMLEQWVGLLSLNFSWKQAVIPDGKSQWLQIICFIFDYGILYLLLYSVKWFWNRSYRLHELEIRYIEEKKNSFQNTTVFKIKKKTCHLIPSNNQ